MNQNQALLDLESLKAVTVLGRGAKGVVFLIIDNKETLALKVISKELIEKKKKRSNGEKEEQEQVDYYKRIWFERDVLSTFNHPLLPKLKSVLSTNQVVGFAIDYCSGGDLNSLRNKQTEKLFSNDVIRFFAAELVLVLEYLHNMGVIYRDLKPENIMIQENGHLMIVDFDLSTKLYANKSGKSNQFQTDQKLYANKSGKSNQFQTEQKVKRKKKIISFSSFFLCKSGISQVESVEDQSVKKSNSVLQKSNSFVGTEDYVAPEIIEGKGHDFAVDWWSLGVVLYEMLYGRTPFRGLNRKETFYRILSKSPDLGGEKTDLRDLIGKLLEKDPSKRISVKEIKGHNYFQGVNWDTILEISRPPHIPAMKWDDEKDLKDVEGMDVHMVVKGIFDGENKLGNEKVVENVEKDSWNLDENKTDWVGGLRNKDHDDFLIF